MTIGDRLRRERTRAGLSQAELADTLGVVSTYISKIENGHRKPSRMLIERWSQATRAGTADLMLDGPALFDLAFDVGQALGPFAARRVLDHLPAEKRRLVSVWPPDGTHALRVRARGSALPDVVGLVGMDITGIGELSAPSVQPVREAHELVAWVRASSEADARAHVERRMARASACGVVSITSIGRVFVAHVAEIAADASMRMQDLVEESPIGLFVPAPL